MTNLPMSLHKCLLTRGYLCLYTSVSLSFCDFLYTYWRGISSKSVLSYLTKHPYDKFNLAKLYTSISKQFHL